MKNQVYRLALAQASRLLGKPGRVLTLAAQFLHRLSNADRRQLSVNAVKEKFKVLGRMTTAYARGHYRMVPVKAMVAIVAALIYFLNPVDLIPDALVGLGFTDDIAILTWVYAQLTAEITAFTTWEQSVMPNHTVR